MKWISFLLLTQLPQQRLTLVYTPFFDQESNVSVGIFAEQGFKHNETEFRFESFRGIAFVPVFVEGKKFEAFGLIRLGLVNRSYFNVSISPNFGIKIKRILIFSGVNISPPEYGFNLGIKL